MTDQRLLLASIFFLALAAALPARGQNKAGEWTIIYYSDADCDLEANMVRDLEEIDRVKPAAGVQVYILCSRAGPKDEDEDGEYTEAPVGKVGNWHGGKVLKLGPEGLESLEDWEDTNMGDPATLVKFVKYVVERAPAKRYALVLSNHGNAWQGVCHDETHDRMLKLNEIRDALEELRPVLGGPLELLGFDACLMASLEVASELARFARYMVASEETEPASGWQYDASFGKLMADPSMDGARLGSLICDDYAASFDKSPDEDMRQSGLGVTLSCLDLRKVPAVAAATQELAAHLEPMAGDEGGWRNLARVRSQTESYGTEAEEEDSSQVYDVGHLAVLARAANLSAQVGGSAEKVRSALGAAVVHQIHGATLKDSRGLTIFWPSSEEVTADGEDNRYADVDFARGGSWFPMIEKFIGVDSRDTSPPAIGAVELSAPRLVKDAEITIASKVKSDDIRSALLVLAADAGKDRVIMGSMPQRQGRNGVLEARWEGHWFHILAGGNSLLCAITGFRRLSGEAEDYRVVVPAQIRPAGRSGWLDVTLHFFLNMDKGRLGGKLVHAFRSGPHGDRQFPLHEGDRLRPVFIAVDDKGEERRVTQEKDGVALDARKLQVSFNIVANGSYLIGFETEDLAGNHALEVAPVSVER